MGRKEKLIERFKSYPNDFTLDEMEKLLGIFSLFRTDKGKTSGSRIMFTNEDGSIKILLHRPHPGNVLKPYQIKKIRQILEQEGFI